MQWDLRITFVSIHFRIIIRVKNNISCFWIGMHRYLNCNMDNMLFYMVYLMYTYKQLKETLFYFKYWLKQRSRYKQDVNVAWNSSIFFFFLNIQTRKKRTNNFVLTFTQLISVGTYKSIYQQVYKTLLATDAAGLIFFQKVDNNRLIGYQMRFFTVCIRALQM